MVDSLNNTDITTMVASPAQVTENQANNNSVPSSIITENKNISNSEESGTIDEELTETEDLRKKLELLAEIEHPIEKVNSPNFGDKLINFIEKPATQAAMKALNFAVLAPNAVNMLTKDETSKKFGDMSFQFFTAAKGIESGISGGIKKRDGIYTLGRFIDIGIAKLAPSNAIYLMRGFTTGVCNVLTGCLNHLGKDGNYKSFNDSLKGFINNFKETMQSIAQNPSKNILKQGSFEALGGMVSFLGGIIGLGGLANGGTDSPMTKLARGVRSTGSIIVDLDRCNPKILENGKVGTFSSGVLYVIEALSDFLGFEGLNKTSGSAGRVLLEAAKKNGESGFTEKIYSLKDLAPIKKAFIDLLSKSFKL